jgi:hypothetical protein
MDKATKLLSRLDETIKCTHLDMGGDDRYTLTPRSYPIIKEIKLYLAQVDRHLTNQSSGRDNSCPICGPGEFRHAYSCPASRR